MPNTDTLENAIAALAITGFRSPIAASGIAATLYPNAQRQVLLDGPQRRAAQTDRVGRRAQVSAHGGAAAASRPSRIDQLELAADRSEQLCCLHHV